MRNVRFVRHVSMCPFLSGEERGIVMCFIHVGVPVRALRITCVLFWLREHGSRGGDENQ